MFNFLKSPKEKPKNNLIGVKEQIKGIEFQFTLRDFEGFSEKAKSKGLVDALSDSEFIKVFGFPSDMQYTILKENFFSDTEQLKHELAFLQEFFKREEKPLYALLRFSSFLRTIIGERVEAFSSLPKNGDFSQQEKERLDYLYTVFSDLEQDQEIPYLLAKNVSPSYLMKAYQPFEKWRESVAPVYIDKQYAVIDNGQNTFQILRIPEEERSKVEKLIEQYQKQMEEMQMSHRPPKLPENASITEMQAYKKKYLESKIHQDMQWGIPRELEAYVIPLKEQVKLFPHLKNEMEFFTDETVFEARSFFKKDIRELIEKDLNIDLTKLSFQEQIYFLTTVVKEKNKDFQRIKDFSQQFKEDGLRTFLSVAHAGKNMGEHILHIGERLSVESAKAIYKKYTEFLYVVADIERFIKNEFSEEIARDYEVVEQIKQKLLQNGVNVLKSWGDTVEMLGVEGSDWVSNDDVFLDLEKISTDTIATLATFKFARKNGFNLSLEDIRNSEFKKRRIEDIGEEEKQEMIRIYRENYIDNQELTEELIEKFKNSFNEKDSEFYIYKLNNKINAFVRFEKKNDGKFASALNVADEAKGFSLGEAMMEQALKTEAKNSILYAEANLEEWNTARYMELGFNAVEENKKYNVPAINIVWDNEMNKLYPSKSFSVKEIISNSFDDKSIIVETYNSLSEFDRSRLGEKVMTRSVFDEKSNKYYIVLEENKTKSI